MSSALQKKSTHELLGKAKLNNSQSFHDANPCSPSRRQTKAGVLKGSPTGLPKLDVNLLQSSI